ncbi:MAG: AAA family ATPase [Epsilonproteobacteria bacterium]|nr:AAA family ATPase [Campylobacterota bacterium]
MKLKNLKLTNFRNFKHLEIEFNEKLNVIVAENGIGKTTLLDAIAIGYGAMLTRFPKVSGKTFEESDLRFDENNQASPYMRVELESYNNIVWDRTQSKNQSKAVKKMIPEAKGLKKLYEYIDGVIEEEHNHVNTPSIPLIMYYGTSRAVLKSPMRKRNFKKEFLRYEALSGSLDADTNFSRLFQWFDAMQNEENRKIKEKRDFDYTLPALESVRNALEVMLPDMQNPRILTRPLRFVIDKKVNQKNVTFRIDQLSDGYKTVLAMVMDISARMAEANPHLDNPNESEALVMIDEVDLHLHPRWQQTILIDLQKAFPNAQFIVTTHSPQVLTTVPSDRIQIISHDKLYSAPAGIEGAEASRVLKRVFDVDLRPKNSVTIKLDSYLDLVYKDQWEDEEALQYRRELDAIFNGEEPALMEADLYIENRKWEMEIEEGY